MRHAMHGPESPDQIAAINRDDLSRGEHRRQSIEGDAIVGIVEDRHEHDAVRNVKVGVACRQASFLEDHGSGHWHLDNVEGLASQVARSSQTPKVFAQRLMIHILGIGFDRGDDCIGSHEAGKVIHVAVSVVAGNAFAEPDHMRCTEIFCEDPLVIFARHPRIALLNFAKQAFFGREQGAASIDVDGTALEHDAGAAVQGTDCLRMRGARHPLADLVIVPPIRVLRPGVEAKVDGDEVALRG